MRNINFTFLLAILMSMVGTNAFAYDAKIDGIYYNFSSGKATVTYYSSIGENRNAYKGSIVIPESVNYNGNTYSVTSIGYNAFNFCTDLTSIEIPNSVTSIGDGAFNSCSSLTSIEIPNSVTSIGEYAFQWCSGLTSVTIGNSVTSIGESAFRNCTGLTSIEIPNSVTSIGEYAFQWCSGLTSIIVEKGNTQYDSRNNCNAIIETSSNTLIAGCKNTVIPNSVTSIGSSAFAGCSGLTFIEIPNSVTSIGVGAFWKCTGLTSITIPNSVIEIENNAFSECEALKNVILNSNRVVSKKRGPTTNSATSTIYSIKNVFGEQVQKYVLGDDVISIGSYAFYGCTDLESINIPNGVTSIGSDAFSYCSNLELTLPDNVGSIGGDAFYKVKKVMANLGKLTPLAIWKSGGIFYDIATDKECTAPVLTAATTTQTTIEWNISPYYEDYQYSIDDKAITGSTYTETGLRPEDYNYRCLYAGHYSTSRTYLLSSCSATTDELNLKVVSRNTTASSLSAKGTYTEGDAEISKKTIKLNNKIIEGDNIYVTGLNPNTSYQATYTVRVKYGKNLQNTWDYTKTDYIYTDALTLTTQQPKVVSLGNVIVAAESNIDDEEENVGFEWRRTDWTDDFASNTGTANMFEGTMEGYIRNLNTEKLWKFRPYYLADDGTYYYGDWVGLDPTNTSYFEPTVHTYAKIEVKGNTALVKGYALGGSDKITVQGFKYWKKASANNRAASDIPSDAMTIEAKGTVMEVNLTDLEYASSYEYVAFATTSEGDTFYGEIKTFETGESPITPGDANGDGLVNVTDIVEIVNYILGHPSAKFNKIAADVNNDGVVNVTDIVSVVNIILSSNARELTNRAAATNNLKLNGGSIKLRNAENYTAAQFDIHLTDGSTVNYLSLNSTSDHQMTWQMVDANTCRVIVYSLSNAPFRAVKDELFNVTLSGNATISNELLVNVDGMVTGINKMQFDKPVDVYDLRGNKVRSNTTDLNGLQKGVYIVNGKKVVIK